jgi:hypothetical protein
MAAAAVWEYAKASARFIFGNQSENSVQNRVLSLLQKGPLSSTEINDAFGGHLLASQLKHSLTALEVSGQIRSELEKTSGRSVTRWSVVTTDAAVAGMPSPAAVQQESKTAFSAKSASSADTDADSLVAQLERMSAERASEQLRSLGFSSR